jgi:hypothetical protein
MSGEMLGGDLRHRLVALAKSFAAVETQRKFKREGEFVGRCGPQYFVGIGHRQRMAHFREQSKNYRSASWR